MGIRVPEVAPDHIYLFIEIHPTDTNQAVKAIMGQISLLRRVPHLLKLFAVGLQLLLQLLENVLHNPEIYQRPTPRILYHWR